MRIFGRASLLAIKLWMSAALSNPFVYLFGSAFAGSVCIVAGVYVMAGVGPAFLASGCFFLAAASYLQKGLRSNV